MGKTVFLGLDGGAFKTEVALVAADGTFLTSVLGAPTQLDQRATPQILENIRGLIEYAAGEAGVSVGDIAASGFGVHGVDYKAELAGQRESLFGPLGLNPATSTLVNDGIVALWGGTPRKRAAVLQIGSGFTGAYRDGYGAETSFDQFNVGLGINLRDEIYFHAFRSLDGREAKSILPNLVFEHFGIYDFEDMIRIWRRGEADLLKVLNIVTVLKDAVARGDRVALKLTRRAAKVYAHDVLTMLKKIGPEPADVVLGGGVLVNGPPLLLEWIEQNVTAKRPDTTVHRPRMRPVFGGCVLAAFSAGVSPGAFFNRIRKTGGKRVAA